MFGLWAGLAIMSRDERERSDLGLKRSRLISVWEKALPSSQPLEDIFERRYKALLSPVRESEATDS